jgi:hypothetical protein
MAGTFTTSARAQVEFRLPEFHLRNTFTWICHIEDRLKSADATYDIILGTDFMSAAGVDISFSKKRSYGRETKFPS